MESGLTKMPRLEPQELRDEAQRLLNLRYQTVDLSVRKVLARCAFDLAQAAAALEDVSAQHSREQDETLN